MASRRESPLMRGGGGGGGGQPLSRGSRIAAAVVVGVALGCLCAFFYPDGFFSRAPDSAIHWPRRADSVACDTSREVANLKSQLLSLERKNAEFRKQINELSMKLQLAGQGENEVLYKAGPFGTVKALRTNPTVSPDLSINPRLAKILEQVAVKKELIVALANSNVKEMLEMWFTNIKRVGISNYLVVALDDSIENFCKSNDVPVYRRDPDDGIDNIGKTGGNHAVSGLTAAVGGRGARRRRGRLHGRAQGGGRGGHSRTSPSGGHVAAAAVSPPPAPAAEDGGAFPFPVAERRAGMLLRVRAGGEEGKDGALAGAGDGGQVPNARKGWRRRQWLRQPQALKVRPPRQARRW